MGAGGITVARSLPIDAAIVSNVLIRLRRDVPGGIARWTLGGRGTAEIDVEFFPMVPPMVPAESAKPAWSTSARLWDPDGVALVAAVVEIRTEAADTCELVLRPAAALNPWWTARLPLFSELAHAALDELSEELLWHATRPDVAKHSDF